ncbi:MAG: DNA polymerase IV [Chlamydiales bacterium]|nr:DNA polymerase IV [Chlamydiales bacterium]
MQQPIRKIIHVDMDAFYASIEQRDNPELRNKPVVVGGPPHSRGVVATASYEARKFGIHSAMPSSHAYRLCPHAIFVPTRFEVYKGVSQQIQSIFHCYTNLVEPLALDEAYLDVTTNKMNERSATRLAQRIQDQIWAETGLTASAGVSFNKFLAKLASGWKKPSGLTVIVPEQAQAFVEQLPIQKFYGVGKATAQKMLALGIHTGADLKNFGHQALMLRFGKMGDFLYHLAICQDERVVNPNRIRKSFGKETTFAHNIHDRNELVKTLETICSQLETSLTKNKCQGRTITLKIRYSNFQTNTRSCTINNATKNAEEILAVSLALLDKTEAFQKPVRLIGISLSTLSSID